MLQEMWHVLTTVAGQTTHDMFSMWSDPSLHTTVEGTVVLFMVCSRGNNGLMRQEVFSLWSVHGLYSSDVSRQLVSYGTVPAGSYQLVGDGKGRHKSWLQQWLQSWSRDLQRNRRDPVVVSHKVYTL
jgi:hypothetical protein